MTDIDFLFEDPEDRKIKEDLANSHITFQPPVNVTWINGQQYHLIKSKDVGRTRISLIDYGKEDSDGRKVFAVVTTPRGEKSQFVMTSVNYNRCVDMMYDVVEDHKKKDHRYGGNWKIHQTMKVNKTVTVRSLRKHGNYAKYVIFIDDKKTKLEYDSLHRAMDAARSLAFDSKGNVLGAT